MQRNDVANDVVAETPAAKGEPVLALSRWHALQFSYVMATRPVIGICGENGYRALFGRVEIAVALLQFVRAVRSGKSCER